MIGYKVVRKIGDKFFSHNLQCVVEYKLGEPAFAYPGSALFVFGTESHAEHFWLASEAYYNCQVSIWEVEYTPTQLHTYPASNPHFTVIPWSMWNGKPEIGWGEWRFPKGTVFADSIKLVREILD